MSGSAPILTPQTITAGKQQTVVVEFDRDFPKNVLVTFDFYDETLSKKIGTVPTNPLGPRAVKANFPEFPQPGVVHVGVQLARSDNLLFPKFRIRVQSPLEAILNAVPYTHSSVINSTAMLASVVGYLVHCDEKELEEMESKTDATLAYILQCALPHVQDWNLSYFLCGKYGHEENLLHLCMRHKLNGAAMELLHSRQLVIHHLYQKSSVDSKTPLEIAKRNDMKKVAQTLERLQVEHKRIGSRSGAAYTPDRKRKKQMIKRAKSIEQDLSVAATRDEYGPLPLYPPGNKKKGKWKLKFGSGGDKIQISAPQQPQLDDDVFPPEHVNHQHTPEEVPRSLPSANRLANRDSKADTGAATFATAAQQQQQPPNKHTIGFTVTEPKGDAPPPLPRARQTLSPTDFTAELSTSPTSKARHSSLIDGSSEGSTHSLEQKKSRPPSSISSGYDSAVSSAIEELKSKRLYIAVLVRDYNWATSPHGEFIVKEGEKVYVTREEPESQVCLGVCNKHYGKFPKQILRRLTSQEVSTIEDYDSIDMFDEDADDNDIYKVPRNIPRPPADSGSDSDQRGDEERDKLVENLQDEGYYMRVPKSSRTLDEYLSAIRQDTELSNDELQEILEIEKKISEKTKVPPPPVLKRLKPDRSGSTEKIEAAAAKPTKQSQHSPPKPGQPEKKFEVVARPKHTSGGEPRENHDKVVMKKPHLKEPIKEEPRKQVPSHGKKKQTPSGVKLSEDDMMVVKRESWPKDEEYDTVKAVNQRQDVAASPQQTSLEIIKQKLNSAGLKSDTSKPKEDEPKEDEADFDSEYDDVAEVLTALETNNKEATEQCSDTNPKAEDIEEIYDTFEEVYDTFVRTQEETNASTTTPQAKEESTETSHPYVNFKILEEKPTTAQSLSKPYPPRSSQTTTPSVPVHQQAQQSSPNTQLQPACPKSPGGTRKKSGDSYPVSSQITTPSVPVHQQAQQSSPNTQLQPACPKSPDGTRKKSGDSYPVSSQITTPSVPVHQQAQQSSPTTQPAYPKSPGGTKKKSGDSYAVRHTSHPESVQVHQQAKQSSNTQPACPQSPGGTRKKTGAPPSPPKRETPFSTRIIMKNAAITSTVVAQTSTTTTSTTTRKNSAQSMVDRATALAERYEPTKLPTADQVVPARPQSPGPVPTPRRNIKRPGYASKMMTKSQSVDVPESYNSLTFPRVTQNEKKPSSPTTNGIKRQPASVKVVAPMDEKDKKAEVPHSYINLEILPLPTGATGSPRIPGRNRSQTVAVNGSRSPQHALQSKIGPPAVAPRPSSGKKGRHEST